MKTPEVFASLRKEDQPGKFICNQALPCRGNTDTGQVEPDMVGGWYIKNVAGSNNNISSMLVSTPIAKVTAIQRANKVLCFMQVCVGPEIQLNENDRPYGW